MLVEFRETTMARKAFGAYLRALRQRKGLSQSGMVNAMHGAEGAISLRTIGRWENGTHEPSVSELAPVIKWLGGSVLRALLLISSERVSETEAELMAQRADDDLSEEELQFFGNLSPRRRQLLRRFLESEGE